MLTQERTLQLDSVRQREAAKTQKDRMIDDLRQKKYESVESDIFCFSMFGNKKLNMELSKNKSKILIE